MDPMGKRHNSARPNCIILIKSVAYCRWTRTATEKVSFQRTRYSFLPSFIRGIHSLVDVDSSVDVNDSAVPKVLFVAAEAEAVEEKEEGVPRLDLASVSLHASSVVGRSPSLTMIVPYDRSRA